MRPLNFTSLPFLHILSAQPPPPLNSCPLRSKRHITNTYISSLVYSSIKQKRKGKKPAKLQVKNFPFPSLTSVLWVGRETRKPPVQNGSHSFSPTLHAASYVRGSDSSIWLWGLLGASPSLSCYVHQCRCFILEKIQVGYCKHLKMTRHWRKADLPHSNWGF